MINENAFGGWALHKDVFMWIRGNIKEGSTILELGSGSATVELCKFYNVYSIEHDKQWVGKSKSTYIHAPLIQYNDENGNYRWYDVDILKEKLPKSYDLLLIDGPPGSIGRIPFLYNLELFNTSVPIMVDDTSRSDELFLCNQLKSKLGKEEIWNFNSGKKGTIVIK